MLKQICIIIKFLLSIFFFTLYSQTFFIKFTKDIPIPFYKNQNLTSYEKKQISFLLKNVAECTLFLNRKDDSFPLKYPDKIAIIGNGARLTYKGGYGSSNVDSNFISSCEQGLENAGFEIMSKEWLDINTGSGENYTLEINSLNFMANVAIYVLSRNSGENRDRKNISGDIFLADDEIRDIIFMENFYQKFLLVLNVNGPVNLTPVKDVKNILLLSQLGVVTGDILANIILGKIIPSGKLSTTWNFENYNNFYENFDENVKYKEGIYVGYRYIDSFKIEPLYHFGYGLSYTNFFFEKIKLTNIKSEIFITVKVKNIGKYKGKEVIQVYVSPSQNNMNKVYKSLVAFNKTEYLNVNETQNLILNFNLKDIARYDEESASYILDKGNYIIRVGNSSINTTNFGYIYLDENIIISKLKNIKNNKIDFKELIPEIEIEDDLSNLQKLSLTKNDFITENSNYDYKYNINKKIINLSNENLTKICIGNFNKKNNKNYFHVYGTAGETIPINNKYLVFADGTAGIRLPHIIPTEFKKPYNSKNDIYLTKNNNYNNKNIDIEKKFIKGKFYIRNAIAFPIETALAQSFNLEFVEKIGDAIGQEMEIFNIDILLAPALNIHRNIFNGRNFEYFSEDPFLSGKMASAIIKGVQKHKNKGVTIKHFACNNQEKNRRTSNSILSERALREIYLKSFEIAIKEANPIAIMTSYNLINGIHSSERKDLLIDILRNEWNFKGLIISDWYNSNEKYEIIKYRRQNIIENIIAGCNLQMPGDISDYEKIIEGLENKKLSRDNLMECASKVVDTLILLKK